MAWRFHVQLEGSNASKSRLAASILPSVITNFILDTGSKDTYVPPVALAALGYRGNMNRTFLKTLQSIHAQLIRLSAGTEVTLRVQSVRTKCIVAHPEDAGRVGLSFMTAGSLTYYFDAGLVAPVLYGECLRSWPDDR
jgi:hypothetical protein